MIQLYSISQNPNNFYHFFDAFHRNLNKKRKLILMEKIKQVILPSFIHYFE